MGPDIRTRAGWHWAGLPAALLLSCAPLDRSAPFAEPPYVHALERVGAAIEGTQGRRGPVNAGWAKVPLLVPKGAPLAGYGHLRKSAPHEARADPLFVRAIALSTGGPPVILLTADLLLLPPTTADAIRARLAISGVRRVHFTASHTHSGLGGYAEGVVWERVFGPFDRKLFELVVDAHVEAAGRAIGDMAPATLGAAEVAVAGLSFNRVERDGPTDDRLFALYLEHLDDGRRAGLWSYGCHPVTRPHGALRVSADYPGDVARAFEGETLDLLAFAAGGVGSTNPRYRVEQTGRMVRRLSSAVSTALKRARQQSRASVSLADGQTTTPHPRIRYRIGEDAMIAGPPVEAAVEIPELRFGAVALDETVLLFVPAELSGELTAVARRRANNSGVRLAIFPFNGSYAGYVVPRRVYDLPQDRRAKLHRYEAQGLAFFGPWAADLFMNVGLRLAAGVFARAAQSRG